MPTMQETPAAVAVAGEPPPEASTAASLGGEAGGERDEQVAQPDGVTRERGSGGGGKPPLAGMANHPAVGTDQSPASFADDEAPDDERLKTGLKQQVIDITSKVEEMEKQVGEVNRMRSALWKTRSTVSVKDKEKGGLSTKKPQQWDAARREAARTKRMAELMRQAGTILKQITQHRWAWPFMEPVDVAGLGLNDYFEIIKRPMDLGTIRDRLDAKDGTGYKHVQEICGDIRLVFTNAMLYNQDGSDVQHMAKTLSEKFEEKWKAVLEPKLQEEEMKRRQEEREANVKDAATLQAAEEAATEKMASDVGRQLEDLDKRLEDLKQQAAPRCRIMSIEEKRQLGHSLGRLPADNLQRVIQIIAQKNPGFNATADEVEVDIDAQEPATLWRLHRYVQSVTGIKARAVSQGSPTSTKRDIVAAAENSGGKRSRRMASP